MISYHDKPITNFKIYNTSTLQISFIIAEVFNQLFIQSINQRINHKTLNTVIIMCLASVDCHLKLKSVILYWVVGTVSSSLFWLGIASSRKEVLTARPES